MVLRSVRLDAPRERHGRSGCPWCLLHIGARFPQQVVQVAARVPLVLGSQHLRDQPMILEQCTLEQARSAGDTLAFWARLPTHLPTVAQPLDAVDAHINNSHLRRRRNSQRRLPVRREQLVQVHRGRRVLDGAVLALLDLPVEMFEY